MLQNLELRQPLPNPGQTILPTTRYCSAVYVAWGSTAPDTAVESKPDANATKSKAANADKNTTAHHSQIIPFLQRCPIYATAAINTLDTTAKSEQLIPSLLVPMPPVPPKSNAADDTAECDEAHTIPHHQTRDELESNAANAAPEIDVATTANDTTNHQNPT